MTYFFPSGLLNDPLIPPFHLAAFKETKKILFHGIQLAHCIAKTELFQNSQKQLLSLLKSPCILGRSQKQCDILRSRLECLLLSGICSLPARLHKLTITLDANGEHSALLVKQACKICLIGARLVVGGNCFFHLQARYEPEATMFSPALDAIVVVYYIFLLV